VEGRCEEERNRMRREGELFRKSTPKIDQTEGVSLAYGLWGRSFELTTKPARKERLSKNKAKLRMTIRNPEAATFLYEGSPSSKSLDFD